MIKEKMMKKQAVILAKPSGAVTIGGELTVIQRKFYDAFLYNAQEVLKRNPTQTWLTVTLADLKDVLNTDERDKNNKYYKQEIEKLKKIDVDYNILEKDKIVEGHTSLLTELEFETSKTTNEVEVRYDIPNRVRDAILNRNKDSIFAKIDLAIKKNLRHRYSLILYDLLRDYENAEIPKMEIEKFRKLFGIERKYKHFADLRKYVLNPTLKELNENPDIEWNVKVELIKNGSKYTHIKFVKTPKPLPELEKQKANAVRDKNYKQIIEQLIQLVPKEHRKKNTEKLLLQALESKGYEYLQKQIEYTNKAKPKQYTAYLKKAIEQDYAGVENSEAVKELEELRKLEEKYAGKTFTQRGKKYIIRDFSREKDGITIHTFVEVDDKTVAKKDLIVKGKTIEEVDKSLAKKIDT